MERRTVILGMSSIVLTGCEATSSYNRSSIGNSGVRVAENTYPAAILIGAALGFAVAKYTGGSPIVGLAVGAFAGGVANAALEYTRYLVRENDAELVPAYRSLTSAVLNDFENFRSENIPILAEKQRIIREAGLTDIEARATDIAASLNSLNKSEQALKGIGLPSRVYEKSVPIYESTSPMIPKVAGKDLTPEARSSKGVADKAISETGAIIIQTAQADLKATLFLQRRGLL